MCGVSHHERPEVERNCVSSVYGARPGRLPPCVYGRCASALRYRHSEAVIRNHREVIKTRGESYNGKNVPVFRIVASLDPCKLFAN